MYNALSPPRVFSVNRFLYRNVREWIQFCFVNSVRTIFILKRSWWLYFSLYIEKRCRSFFDGSNCSYSGSNAICQRPLKTCNAAEWNDFENLSISREVFWEKSNRSFARGVNIETMYGYVNSFYTGNIVRRTARRNEMLKY